MTYKVCWTPNAAVHVIELPPTSDFVTGQANTETFNDKDEAYSRAFNLGYRGSMIRPFELEEPYDAGEYVMFNDKLFKALESVTPYNTSIPEATPLEAPGKWQLL